jgi:choice-of-anchor B domain-containing protein
MRRGLGLTAILAGVLALTGAAAAQTSYNMVLLKNLDDYPGGNDCWGYSANGVEIAIFGHETGTSFVDATDPENAVEVFNLPGATSIWRDIKTYQNYAYIVTEGGGVGTGLQIVDLTDPLNPVHVTTYTAGGFTTAHNIWIDTAAGYAYACGANGGTYVLDLTNPTSPVEVDVFGAYYIHDLYVAGGRGYAGAISSGSLRVMNTTNPANITTLASHFYSGAATHNAWPTSNGMFCATTDETGGGHMKIWDVSNLSNITLASEFDTSTEKAIIHNVLIKDDMAYASWYTAGTRVVDLTDPTDPVEVGYYDTHPAPGGAFHGNWGVYPFRSDDVVYASDRQTGLYILRFTGDFAGTISGRVTDGQSLGAIAGATVQAAGAPASLSTNGSGDYSGRVSGGTYEVITTKFGYGPDTTSVTIPPQGSVVNDVTLSPIPFGTVEIQVVHSGTLDPVEGVLVDVPGTPVTGLVTDPSGMVSLSLPAGPVWDVQIARFGVQPTNVAIVATAATTTPVTVEVVPGFSDDFAIDQAWVAGAVDDGATGGTWERAIPVPSFFSGPVGVDADASLTGDGYAFVTQNHVPAAFVGTSDVDGGKTTLLSPVFDASGLGSLTLSYQRWFSNRAPSPDNDEFRADVSTDGGSSWTNLETVNVGTDSWALVSIDVTALVPATSTMQLRFVAEDVNAATYVEAGLDDVQLTSSATGIVAIGGGAGSGLRLAAPAPNPFRGSTRISFDLPAAGRTRLEVFNVAGRRVAVLLDGERVAAGSHAVTWRGEDERGRLVAPGVYFARLTAADGERTRKLVRIR